MISKILYLSFMFLTAMQLFACDANCVTCHPNLLKDGEMDSNHAILNRCKKCHTKQEDSEDHGACGQDCWSCHDISKVDMINVPEHKVLPSCIKCHQNINKSFFDVSGGTKNSGMLIDSIKGGF